MGRVSGLPHRKKSPVFPSILNRRRRFLRCLWWAALYAFCTPTTTHHHHHHHCTSLFLFLSINSFSLSFTGVAGRKYCRPHPFGHSLLFGSYLPQSVLYLGIDRCLKHIVDGGRTCTFYWATSTLCVCFFHYFALLRMDGWMGWMVHCHLPSLSYRRHYSRACINCQDSFLPRPHLCVHASSPPFAIIVLNSCALYAVAKYLLYRARSIRHR